ncbi:MAG TPA: RNA methyltransferase [Elusimicrobiota bacterium]|nr:RNA methyltransferase [Elusimicrobiota bacterium]
MNEKSIRVMLVRPRNPNNVGAAARAMANFGLKDLAVVDPYEPVWRESVAALDGAEAVLRLARKLSFPEAVSDCHLVLGTSTGKRRNLSQPLVLLPELRDFLARRLPPAGRAAIVFGPEKSGLRNEDLDRCHAWLKIPTLDEAPSMNLGQAVAVVGYELARAAAKGSVAAPSAPAKKRVLPPARQMENLLAAISRVVERLDYRDAAFRGAQIKHLRHSILRWNLDRADAGRLLLLFEKISRRLPED